MSRLRVLVTNDDGVHATGILALATAIAADGHDVLVAAPMGDMSGSAAALGPGHSDGVRVERLVLPALGESVPVVAVDGPPGMCVMAAHLGAFGDRPDIVASGINLGSNTGRAVLFSGTVGAALAAQRFGIPAVAVSIRLSDAELHLETAGAFGAAAVRWLAETAGATESPTALNVNVPSLPMDEIKGVREARLARFGSVRTVIETRDDGWLGMVLRETDEPLEDDTDTMLVRAGYVTVNAVIGPHAVDANGADRVLGEVLGVREAG